VGDLLHAVEQEIPDGRGLRLQGKISDFIVAQIHNIPESQKQLLINRDHPMLKHAS
jgi:hypothetical protein